MLTPDVWLRVNWRTLRVELEAGAHIGWMRHRALDDENVSDTDLDSVGINDVERATFQQFGYALEFKYGFFDDRFHIGFDQGYAMGDSEPSENTPANAAYFRPWAAFYFFQRNASARLDVQYALAHAKTATAGNAFSYGIEVDGAIRYHDVREPIFVQLQYGVMFPLKAFDRDLGVGLTDAKAAQTVQAQVGIKF